MQTKAALLLTVSLTLFGCKERPATARAQGGGHGHGHGAAEAHEEEPATTQITVWSGRFEVFAEHEAAAAGAPVTFITHVTEVATGEARSEGMVKFVMKQGARVLEHPQARPSRPGIYLAEITFPEAGAWELSLVIPTGSEADTVLLGTVQVYQNADAARKAELPEAPEGLSFLKEQQWKMRMRIAPAERRTISEHARLFGRVTPRPGASVQIPLPGSGTLLPANGPIPIAGEEVRSGQILGRVEVPFSELAVTLLQAKSQTARVATEREQAKVNLDRVRALYEQQARSQRELQEADFAFRSADAAFNAAQELEASFGDTSKPGYLLKSPVHGMIASVPTAESPAFTILTSRDVMVEALVPQSVASRFGENIVVTVAPRGSTNQYTELTAILAPVAEARSGRFTLTTVITNAPRTLAPGTQVVAHARTETSESAVVIPLSAIVDEDGRATAYVQLGGETFEKRELGLGIQDVSHVQVLSGISEGERVAITGAFAIRLAAASSTIPAHGHAH